MYMKARLVMLLDRALRHRVLWLCSLAWDLELERDYPNIAYPRRVRGRKS